MKPNRIYTLLGCTIEVRPGQQTAKASKPGGESREFRSEPAGASAEVQAQRWVHGISQQNWTHADEVTVSMEPNTTIVVPAEAATEHVALDQDGKWKPIDELTYTAPTDEATELDN